MVNVLYLILVIIENLSHNFTVTCFIIIQLPTSQNIMIIVTTNRITVYLYLPPHSILLLIVSAKQNQFRCRWPLFGLHTVEITEIYSHLKKESQIFRETKASITKLQCKMFSRKFSHVRVIFGYFHTVAFVPNEKPYINTITSVNRQ